MLKKKKNISFVYYIVSYEIIQHCINCIDAYCISSLFIERAIGNPGCSSL